MAHPNHPLAGQVVKVVYETAGHPVYTERCWVIELTDQTCAKVPLSWAVLVDDTTGLEPGVEGISPGSLWVDVTGLLNLANWFVT